MEETGRGSSTERDTAVANTIVVHRGGLEGLGFGGSRV